MLCEPFFRSFRNSANIPKTRARDLRAAIKSVGQDIPFIQVPPGGDFSSTRSNRLLRALVKQLKIPDEKAKGWWLKYRKEIYRAHRDLFNKVASRARAVLRTTAIDLFGPKPDGDEPEVKLNWLRDAKEVIKKFPKRNGNIEVRSNKKNCISRKPFALSFVQQQPSVCHVSQVWRLIDRIARTAYSLDVGKARAKREPLYQIMSRAQEAYLLVVLEYYGRGMLSHPFLTFHRPPSKLIYNIRLFAYVFIFHFEK